MSRNVTILVIILVIILIAGYLLYLRGRFGPVVQQPVAVTPTVIPTIVVSPTVAASPSAAATPSGARVSPTRTSTSSGRTVR